MATESRHGESVTVGRSAGAFGWTDRLTETQFAYLLLTPMILLLGIVALWPLWRTFVISLQADALTGASQIGSFVGLDNYVAILTGERAAILPRPFWPEVTATFPFVQVNSLFTTALAATLIFVFVSVFFETIIGFAQALVLDQEFAGRRWVRVAIILPWAIPIVIQGMIFFLLFQPNIGFATDWLSSLGLLSETPLSTPSNVMAIIIVADIWKTSAFMALLILAGLQSIDRSLYNVARVSGASAVQRFKMITLPLVLPTVLVAVLFRTVRAMRVFGLIETVSSCTTVPSLSCLVVSTWSSRLYGSSAAIAFITAVIVAAGVSIYIVKYGQQEVA